MKKQLIILIPLAFLILFFVLNLVLGLSLPLKGMAYKSNENDDIYIVFNGDGKATYTDDSSDRERTLSYIVAGNQIRTRDGSSNVEMLYKEGYSLKTMSTYDNHEYTYTCGTAVAFQVLLAIGEAVCLTIIAIVAVYRVRNLLRRIDLIERKLNDKTNKGL